MIKLTAFNYKTKESALKRHHYAIEVVESKLFERDAELETNKNLGGSYVEMEYIPPFEFKPEDYIVTEFPLRLRKDNIKEYKVNSEGLVEIETTSNKYYAIKEDLEFMDNKFGVQD